jgi:polar amino acid transport system substrate-binding protein
MKKNIFMIILIAVILVFSIALSGCTEVDENKIIVGTSADFPPFEYVDENQNIIGFDIDLIKSILTNQGYTVEVKDIAFDSLIASLQAGKIDVIAAGMSITEEREEQIDFSDPYYEADQSVLINSETDIIIDSTDDLVNLTIGAQTGTTGAAWIEENLIDEDLMDENSLKQYETYTLAILDLENQNLDAIILDKPVALAYGEDEDLIVVYTIITEESYGFGVEEGNTNLINNINQGLDDIIDTEEWNNLVKKYFE